MEEKLFKSKIFKNQIMYRNPIAGYGDMYHSDPKINEFINGFVDGNVLLQLKRVGEFVINQNKKYTVLELPPFGGKTSVAYVAAFLKTYNLGKNALLIYPSEVKREIAITFIKRKSRDLYYHEFPSFVELTEDTTLTSEYVYRPNIYITDIYSLHLNILTNINYPLFWQQMGFIGVEDVNNYDEDLGSNAGYVFRRLFAKLSKYDADYSFLCTKIPHTSRLEDINKLTGIEESKFDYINSNSKGAPACDLIHWYPPVKSIDYQTGKFEIKYEDYYEELANLLSGVMSENKRVAILWERSVISEEDIANIRVSHGELRDEESLLFIGNTLEDIRLQMLSHPEYLDFKDIDVFVIAGCEKPISEYLSNLKHIGKEQHLVIIYNHQTPSLQYEAHRQVKENKSAQSGLSVKSLNLKLTDRVIIDNHIKYLKEEYPDISLQTLRDMNFPADFINRYIESPQPSFEYLYLNKDIKFLPKITRYKEQLIESSTSSLYSLISLQNGIRAEIGKIADYTVRAYCFRHAKLVHRNKRYRILDVDYNRKEVTVETMHDEKIVTYKISDYDIDCDSQEADIHTDALTAFNGNVSLNRNNCKVSETIYGTKQTKNFLTYFLNLFESSITTFKDEILPVLELKIKFQIIRYLYDQVQDHNTDIHNLGRKVLHTLAHLLIESVRTKQYVRSDEIKIKIKIPEENESDNDYSLYFIDLTGMNGDFFDIFIQSHSIIELFEIIEDILLHCPCNRGSKACIQVDYCNIPDCIDNARLDKLTTFRLVELLLNRNNDDVGLRLRWKSISNVWDIDRTGIGTDHVRRKDDLELFARLIMEKKGGITFNDKYYDSRFMRLDEINRYSSADGTPVMLGLCDRNNSQIIYIPGLPEMQMLETIFHERFHNYVRINQGGKNNIHQSLEYFNWDDIDDPKNIPYIGMLVIEGSAAWFSLRMMEYFAAIDYIQNVSRSYILEYLTGLHLLLKVESKYGYGGVLEQLKKGFNIIEFREVYTTEIQQQLEEHLNSGAMIEGESDEGHVPDWLRCLKVNQLTTNSNRVSYYLRARLDPVRGRDGLIPMINGQDPDVRHVNPQNIENFARMHPAGFSQQNNVVEILRRVGLGEGEGLLCETCPSNCTLFQACMINGGRRVFKEIILNAFPAR